MADPRLEHGEQLEENAPPPYSAATTTRLIETSTSVRGDGRIDVDLDSKLGFALSRLIQNPPDYYALEAAIPEFKPAEWSIKLNIVIQVVGSRGDVQPFIALGNELQKHGHRVRLATHDTFRDFVQSHGLEFYPIGGDPAALMAYMVKNPALFPNMKSLQGGEIQSKRRMIAQILDGCWNSCIEPDPISLKPFVADAIIANPPSFAHIHCAQALGIPVHLMFTMPWSATKTFPHPLANLTFSNTDPKMANYVSYIIVEWLTWHGLADIINRWRRGMDLEPIPIWDGPNLVDSLKIPFTYCWSPALVPKPRDWPGHIDVCGFFFRDPPTYSPSSELATFLNAGPPPIYIGFGSIVIEDPESLSSIIMEAIKMTGVRAIISRGWSDLGGVEQDNIFYIGDCPHEWLFQKVSAVIHHGGAGTTACGLLNGRPTCIIPFFGDQPFWGSMVAASGAGPQPIAYRSLTPLNLADGIQYCLTDGASEAAARISLSMKNEGSGVKAAVDSFHAHLPLERLPCDIIPDQPAVWTYRNGKRQLRLSKIAAEILSEYMRIERQKLEPHETSPIIIEPRHYDPLSSSLGVAVGTTTTVAKATTDIVVEPYREYHRRSHKRSASRGDVSSNASDNGGEGPSTRPASDNTEARSSFNDGWATAGAMAGASAKSLGMVGVKSTKSLLVDIPLACAEGFRAVPALYGETVRDNGQVTDWKSGTVVGAKSFAYNMVEGLTDIVTLPYKASKEENSGLEVTKAVGKGLVSMVTKPATGAFGSIAYPFLGVSKSIRSLVKTTTRKRIMAARRVEGEYLMRMREQLGIEAQMVLETYESSRRQG